jgi:hypothetical protein
MHEPERLNEFTDGELTELLRVLRAPDDVTPRAGFYGRVMNRIEAQQKSSIWSVFLEPVFSKRLAFASVAFMLLMGFALFTATPESDEEFAFGTGSSSVFVNEDQAAPVLGSVDALRAQPVSLMEPERGRDVVLVDLVSYQER